jgi:serine acetyltransferase
VGKWAIIGSGAVVTRNIPAYGLAYGNPARLTGFVCPCGQRLPTAQVSPADIQDTVNLTCAGCQGQINLPGAVYRQIL